MDSTEEATIRARDARYGKSISGIMSPQAVFDRRLLLAELDRLRALLAEPTDAMVEAALRSWFSYSGGYVYSEAAKAEMRAALGAAWKERAMTKTHDAFGDRNVFGEPRQPSPGLVEGATLEPSGALAEALAKARFELTHPGSELVHWDKLPNWLRALKVHDERRVLETALKAVQP